MFTLGAIACPRCAATLTARSFTAAEDGMEAEAELSCSGCRAKYSLLATLVNRPGPVPVSPPSPRVAEQEPAQVVETPGDLAVRIDAAAEALRQQTHQPPVMILHPLNEDGSLKQEPPPSDLPEHQPPATGLEDLNHVVTPTETGHLKASDHRDAGGFYLCPHPGCGEVTESPQGWAAHRRQHEVPELCTNGCGKLCKASGLRKHLRSCSGPPGAPGPAPKDGPPPIQPRQPKVKGVVDPAATEAALTAAAERVDVAKTRAATQAAKILEKSGGEAAPAKPIQHRTSATCGWSDEAGLCGRGREGKERGWRRARVPTGWMDLCPDHADATDDQVTHLLDPDSLTPLT